MVSPQSDDEQFDFYLKFAKPLVLNLSDTNDRIKAAAWIRKLKDEADNASLRTDYLKLLLFVLQRRKLIGPFAVIPDDARPLQPFPEEINLQDIAKNFVEIDKQVLKEAIEKGGFGEWPPYNVACSSDLKEYAASQDIPNFGVHVYFAISKDPIHNWEQKNKAIFPIGEKIETSNDFGLSTNISPNISSFVPQEQTSPILEKSPKKEEGGDGSARSPDRKDVEPPTSDPFDVETSTTPTWGSNLMKVNDEVLVEHVDEDDYDFNMSNRDMLDINDEDIDLDEVEGISDLEDSFYLEGDKLISPVCTPCSSPAPSLPYNTPPIPSVNLPSPAPSLPYKSPPVPTVNLPSPAPSLPYRTPPKPGTPNNFLFDSSDVCNDDMLDYIDDSMELIEDVSFEDAAMYLHMDRLMTPPKDQPCEPCECSSSAMQSPAPSLPYRTPPIPRSPRPQTPSQMHSQPDQSLRSPQYRQALKRSEEEELKRLEREIFDEIQTQDLDHTQMSVNIKKMRQLEKQLETSGEGLGGDSFIAPEDKDFRWLPGISPGPGLPVDVEQDPDLWESFGWWTDDPNEIFEYIPPSPRVCGSPNLNDEEEERWADVPATPPIFSRDPQIQTGPGAQRIYAIEEFGMESFEEPVWTPAEQYMRYLPESPYQDPRDIDRQTLDIAQYNQSLELKKQVFDMQDVAEGDYFFTEEQAPTDDLEMSFQEQDYQRMTHAQAAFEAMLHGAHGAPPSPPLPPPEDQMQREEAMVDVEFLAKTPPKFVFEPEFASTPPEYLPNTSINIDDLDETISKYVEDEIKIIQSNIPVTTPQRSPSPKRKKRFIGNETLPNIQDIDLTNENIVSSPELKTPPKYHVTPRKDINWDTVIGEPRKLTPLKPAYLGIPDDERQAKSAKRKKELAKMYHEQFASPPLIQSPDTPPHLIDEPIPSDLGSPLPPKKLPPPGWTWQSPPASRIPNLTPHIIKIPTCLTPPKKMSEDVTMFYESPPHEIYSPPPSPSSAMGTLQFSPPERFDSPPSPVRSPGGRPIYANWQAAEATDEIDMEEVFPIQYKDFIIEEYPDLYTSPVRIKSPEILKELDEKTAKLSPTTKKKFYDAEIEALENEIFNAPSTPCRVDSRVARSPGSPVTPEYERKMWRESLKLHDLDDYWKRQWVVRPKPGKTKAIKRFTVGSRLRTIPEPSSPQNQQNIKSPEVRPEEQYILTEEDIANIKAQIESLNRAEEIATHRVREREGANKQVLQDITDLTKLTLPTPPRKYWYQDPHADQSYIDQLERAVKEMEALYRKKEIEIDVKERIQSQFASPPRPCKKPIVHPFDETLPEDIELPPALLPPSGWSWKTPPKYKFKDYVPPEKRSPTGLESPEKMSEDVTMFYESPPRELLSPPSPRTAVSALQRTPTYGFNLPSSPIRSPGGRPITDSWQIDNIIDEIDLDKVYPAQFEDIYEEEIPELYMSPPKVCGVGKSTPKVNITLPKLSTPTTRITNRPLSPVTPEQERQLWKEKLRLHELREYWRKQWTVRPKPGKSRKVKRFTTRPALHTILDEREQLSPETQPIKDERTIQAIAELNASIQQAVRKHKATEAVLQDILDLPETLTFIPSKKIRYPVINDPNADIESIAQQQKELGEHVYELEKAILKNEIRVRVEEQFASPPRISSPEQVVHPFDQSLSEELDLPPALLPPSGWSWQSPPKYKLPEYKTETKYSPRLLSPVKDFSKDVTMFYESPPREFLSPTSPSNAQSLSPSLYSPIRSPYGEEDNLYSDNIVTAEYECIDEEEDPGLYVSPTKVKSPEQIQQHETTPTNQIPIMSLEEQIAALECECFGEKITIPVKKIKRGVLPDTTAPAIPHIPHSPETPEFKRKLWMDSLRLHEFDKHEQYPKRQFVIQPTPSKRVRIPRHPPKPKLETVSDLKEPTPLKVKREDIIKAEKKMQESRRIYEEAQKQAMLDILKLQELTLPSMPKKSPCYRESSEEQKAKLKEEIARRVREQFSSPPRKIEPESIITHPFDEELPTNLPSALLPPSGWAWKTPPRMQQQPFVERRIVSPTGVSPPQIFDPESLIYESPPLVPQEEDLEAAYSPCSHVETYAKSPERSPLKFPEVKPLQTPGRPLVQSPRRTPISPRALPVFSPIKSSIPSENNWTQICSPLSKDIDEEFPPEELSKLPSPTRSNEPEPVPDEEYKLFVEHEINAIENAMKRIEELQQNAPPCTPPTPRYARKIWQQELALRPPLQLQKREWVVKPSPGRAYRVRKSKKPGLSPVKEKYLEWSPEVVYKSPIISPQAISPEIQPRSPQITPKNWTWKTPSPQALKTARNKLIDEGVIPFEIPPEETLYSPEILSESPPYIPQTPPDTSPIDVCSPCSGASPPQLTPEFYYSPESESPVLSPDISPDISPYGSPLRSPSGRPVVSEWGQQHDDEFYFSEILPNQHEYVDEEVPPDEIYATALPPTPPPLPASPRPYYHQIRLTPRTRPKPDQSMFSPERSPTRSPGIAYQSLMSPGRSYEAQSLRRGPTPESAKRSYEPSMEAIRFEPKRPTPKASPPVEYQTPTRRQVRGDRRGRRINRDAPRRRLVFEEDEHMEDEAGNIQNLQRALEMSVVTDSLRDVDAESPPRDANISVLTDFDYEPEEFNLFEDENAEEYDVRLPFEGQHYISQDRSPIPVTEEIPEEERDFRWLSCGSYCQTPKR